MPAVDERRISRVVEDRYGLSSRRGGDGGSGTGPPGPTGPTGPQGPQGPAGQSGNGMNWSAAGAVGPLGAFLNPINFGADPTGAADSTTAIQDAIDACPDRGTVYVAGIFKITAPLVIDRPMRFIGDGPENSSKLVPTSALAGLKVLSVDLTSADHHPEVGGLAIDCSACPTATGLYLDNFDFGKFWDLKVRNANIGFLADGLCGISDFERCHAIYNASSGSFEAGFKMAHDNVVGNWYRACQVYITSGGAQMEAGWKVTAARDLHWIGCYAYRSPALTAIMPFGWKIALAGGSFGGFMFDQCEADGITDRTSDGAATASGFYFENAAKVQAGKLWSSAASSGSGDTDHPAIQIIGGSELMFDDSCRLNGTDAFYLRSSPATLTLKGELGSAVLTGINIDSGAPPTGLVHDLNPNSANASYVPSNQLAYLGERTKQACPLHRKTSTITGTDVVRLPPGIVGIDTANNKLVVKYTDGSLHAADLVAYP